MCCHFHPTHLLWAREGSCVLTTVVDVETRSRRSKVAGCGRQLYIHYSTYIILSYIITFLCPGWGCFLLCNYVAHSLSLSLPPPPPSPRLPFSPSSFSLVNTGQYSKMFSPLDAGTSTLDAPASRTVENMSLFFINYSFSNTLYVF